MLNMLSGLMVCYGVCVCVCGCVVDVGVGLGCVVFDYVCVGILWCCGCVLYDGLCWCWWCLWLLLIV